MFPLTSSRIWMVKTYDCNTWSRCFSSSASMTVTHWLSAHWSCSCWDLNSSSRSSRHLGLLSTRGYTYSLRWGVVPAKIHTSHQCPVHMDRSLTLEPHLHNTIFWIFPTQLLSYLLVNLAAALSWWSCVLCPVPECWWRRGSLCAPAR